MYFFGLDYIFLYFTSVTLPYVLLFVLLVQMPLLCIYRDLVYIISGQQVKHLDQYDLINHTPITMTHSSQQPYL